MLEHCMTCFFLFVVAVIFHVFKVEDLIYLLSVIEFSHFFSLNFHSHICNVIKVKRTACGWRFKGTGSGVKWQCMFCQLGLMGKLI